MAPIEKITDLLAKRCESSPAVTFEYFPPKTEQGVKSLYERLERISQNEPMFVDFTWGAGGSTSDLTLELCKNAKERYSINPNMHITCTNMPLEKLKAGLDQAREAGIRNIVALRGDPPAGEEAWVATDGGLRCALDLVRYIRREYGDYFCISVAGYPEGHPTAITKVESGQTLSEAEEGRVVTSQNDGQFVCTDEAFSKEISYLKEKVDAGADMVLTQMFFDVEVFATFVTTCRAAGINVPIIPGIMCIQNYGGFNRMTEFCRSRVPPAVRTEMDARKDDAEAIKQYGVQFGVEVCQALIKLKVPVLHFYTLNLSKVVLDIVDKLGLSPENAIEPCSAAE